MDFITIFLICCVAVQALTIWIAAKISEEERDRASRVLTCVNITAILVFVPPLYDLRVKVFRYLIYHPVQAGIIVLAFQAATIGLATKVSSSMKQAAVKGFIIINSVFITMFFPLYFLL